MLKIIRFYYGTYNNNEIMIVYKHNGNLLQYSCLENPTEEPGRLQSMGSLRVGHD